MMQFHSARLVFPTGEARVSLSLYWTQKRLQAAARVPCHAEQASPCFEGRLG